MTANCIACGKEGGKEVCDPRSGLFNGKCWECAVGPLAYNGLMVARLYQAALEVVNRHDNGILSSLAGDSAAIEELREALQESSAKKPTEQQPRSNPENIKD